MDADRDRTLRIEIPPCDVAKEAGEVGWSTVDNLNGWQVTVPGETTLHWEGTIDLSGYARDYKTFYPKGGVIQRGPYMTDRGGAGSVTYTVISSVPMNPLTIVGQIATGGGVGFINSQAINAGGLDTSQQDWETVIFAEAQVNVTNTNISPNTFGVQQPLERNQSGSMSPTAAQVLYALVVWFPFASSDSTRVLLPASRVILPGTMDQEPELEYMQRLARSVQLANQV